MLLGDIKDSIHSIIERCDPNRIKFIAGEENDTLLICFSSRGKKKFELFKTLVNTKKNILFINDDVDGYYHEKITGLCDDHNDLIALLRKVSIVFCKQKIICIGSSMGGYGALLFGTFIKADKVIAFSPQVNLNPILSLTPQEHSKAAFNNITTDIINNKHTEYHIFCSLMPEDLYHIVPLKDFNHIQLSILNTNSIAFGHNILAELLKNGYDLTDFLMKIINGNYVDEIITYNNIIENQYISDNLIYNVECFHKNEFHLCLDFFTKAFYLFPKWSQVAYYAVKSGNIQIDLLLKAIVNSPEAYFLYFDFLIILSNNLNSLFDKYLEQASLVGNIKKEDLLGKLSDYMKKIKKNDTAFLIREKILAEYPENTSALYANGLYFLNKKDYNKSLTCFSTVINLLSSEQENWRYNQSKVHISTINKRLNQQEKSHDDVVKMKSSVEFKFKKYSFLHLPNSDNNTDELFVFFSPHGKYAFKKHFPHLNKLHVMDNSACYYVLNAGTATHFLLTWAKEHGYKKVMFVGSSKGGYGALLWNAIARSMMEKQDGFSDMIVRAVAFSPQSLLYPKNDFYNYPSYLNLLRKIESDENTRKTFEKYGDLTHFKNFLHQTARIYYNSGYELDRVEALRLDKNGVECYGLPFDFHGSSFPILYAGLPEVEIYKILDAQSKKNDADFNESNIDNMRIAKKISEYTDFKIDDVLSFF